MNIDEAIERLQTDLREGTGSNNDDVRTVLAELKRLRAALITARVDTLTEVLETWSASLASKQKAYDERPDEYLAREAREEIATLRVVVADVQRMLTNAQAAPKTTSVCATAASGECGMCGYAPCMCDQQ